MNCVICRLKFNIFYSSLLLLFSLVSILNPVSIYSDTNYSLKKPVVLFWCSFPHTIKNITYVTPQVWLENSEDKGSEKKRMSEHSQKVWIEKGVTPLVWRGGKSEHSKNEDQLVKYWSSPLEQGFAGIAIDEFGARDKDVNNRMIAALVRVKEIFPDRCIAVWHSGLLSRKTAEAYRKGADLILLETYISSTSTLGIKAWYNFNQARSVGISQKTIFALGINDEAPEDKVRFGVRWANTQKKLEAQMELIKRRAAETPGVAFYAIHASDEMIKAADYLAGELFF